MSSDITFVERLDVAISVATTGYTEDAEITAICATVYRSGEDVKRFNTLIQPAGNVVEASDAVQLSGHTTSMLKANKAMSATMASGYFSDFIKELKDGTLLGGGEYYLVPIVHSALFTMEMITTNFTVDLLDAFSNPIDIRAIAEVDNMRAMCKGDQAKYTHIVTAYPSVSLNSIASNLGVDVRKRGVSYASDGADMVWECYKRMVEHV